MRTDKRHSASREPVEIRRNNLLVAESVNRIKALIIGDDKQHVRLFVHKSTTHKMQNENLQKNYITYPHPFSTKNEARELIKT
jgi:hypothetical protein